MPGFLLRQLATAALTANAVRPVPGYQVAVPSMAAGWLTSELAPHLLALTVADAVRELARGRRDRPALALAAGSALALAAVVAQSARAQEHVDRALVEALGPDYRDRLSATYTDLDLSTPLSQLAMPFRLHDDEVEVVKDLPYDTEHGKRGLLDVYRQRGTDATDAPVLLHVHGGAWSIGDKEHQGIPLMLHMAARGWVCVTINYRLSPRDPFPAHIVDVKRAIAWIREHGPAYGADPSFLAVTGGSAGGHLAALAALTPDDPEYQPGFEDADTSVQAAAPHYGVYDFAGASGGRAAQLMRDRFLGPKVLFKDPVSDLADFERASPLLRVNADAPPFFVVHGRSDSLVDVDQARTFVAALREVSHQPVAYAELPGTQHAFDVFPSIRSAAVVRGVDRFLRFSHDAWVAARTTP
ncbi:alpha/beta hydrolase [Nocardioides panacis]|uniref:Alpha/beta hydrolase n=1 Tax=Nocardioides panacis TaxID=2849501 RepID=A0A975Y1I0_9ACTN|nr:alpha/beta hydrolase [Nocardioides panacis]QWZ09532.1 alpha/beta hydrolase [Nocardioides panacis]